VEQSTYEEFLLIIGESGFNHDFSNASINRSAVWNSTVIFFLPVIDLLFGGNAQKKYRTPDLTEIELRVMKILNQKILENMALAWLDCIRFEPVIGSWKQTPIQPDHSPRTVAIITIYN
jgi:flagellar motor switch protein FliM